MQLAFVCNCQASVARRVAHMPIRQWNRRDPNNWWRRVAFNHQMDQMSLYLRLKINLMPPDTSMGSKYTKNILRPGPRPRSYWESLELSSRLPTDLRPLRDTERMIANYRDTERENFIRHNMNSNIMQYDWTYINQVTGCQNRHRPNKLLATLWKKKKHTHTQVTQKVKIYSEIQTQNHITTVAQIRFIMLLILAHNIVNQVNGQFSFKRIKVLDFSKSFW